MLTLLKVSSVALTHFLYITLFKLNSVKRIENSNERVFFARKILKGLSDKVIKVAGIEIEVIYENIESIKNINYKEGVVLVSNHQSNFDIPVLVSGLDIPIGFVAKKEMEKWPLYSSWMKESKCIFLDRSNIREGIKGIQRAVDIVKQGYPTVIFPEGERSTDGKIKKFKKGSFKLATETKGYLIPITIDGTFSIQSKGSIKIQKNKKVKIYVDKPINIKEYSSKNEIELNDYVQNLIEKRLKKVKKQ